MQNICIIINSRSRLKKRLLQQLSSLDQNHYRYSLFETTPLINATTLTKQALSSSCNLLIIAGGDGTVNEVINGYMALEQAMRLQVTLAILPIGSGNDFSKTLGQTTTLSQIIKCYRNTRIVDTDVGLMHFFNNEGTPANRYFINIADVGIGGDIAQIVNRKKKCLGASWAYHSAIIQGLMGYQNREIEVTFDSQLWHGDILGLIIANGRYFGHGLCIAPDARLDDMEFEMVTLGDLGIFDYLKYLGRIKRGEKIIHPQVSYHQARNIRVKSFRHPLPIDMDGEFVGYTPMEVSVIPKAVRFVVADNS